MAQKKNPFKLAFNMPTTLMGIRQSLATPKKRSVTPPTYQTIDVGPKPQMTDYQEHQDMVKGLIGEEISPEEEARRKRAATTVGAVGALGNALSAFSNLAFAGDVVPSQKLPQTYDAGKDVKEFEDRTRKAREAYLRSNMAAKQADRGNYLQDTKQWLEGMAHNQTAAINAYKAQTDREKAEQVATAKADADAQKQANWERTQTHKEDVHEFNKGKFDRQAGQRDRQLGIMEGREERLGKNGGSGGKKDKTYNVEGAEYDNEYDAYEALPDEYKRPRAKSSDARKAAIAKYNKAQRDAGNQPSPSTSEAEPPKETDSKTAPALRKQKGQKADESKTAPALRNKKSNL